MDIDTRDFDLTEDDLNKLETVLEKAKDSILAANCCLALLTSDRLPKQVRRVLYLSHNRSTKVIENHYRYTLKSSSQLVSLQ